MAETAASPTEAMTRSPHFRAASAVLTLLAFLAAALGARPAAAQPGQAQSGRTLSNIATLAWDAPGGRAERMSNRVDIAVEVAPGATADLSRFEGNASGSTMLGGTRCGAPGAETPMELPTAYAGPSVGEAQVAGRPQFRAGEPMVISLAYAAANRNAGRVETLAVEVTTDGGDIEQLVLSETAPDSGRFAGVILTIRGAVPVRGDCKLSVRPGATARFAFTDGNGGLTATADADFLIDPFGIVFDSATGTPVSGARVSILEADTGQPAAVFGDDGQSNYPNMVISGEAVTDAGGTRYAFAAGEYRFPLLRRGRYVIRVEPPDPYRAPSVATPADIAPLARPDGGRFVVVDGSYGRPFALTTPAPVRIDLPVDAPTSGLLLTKEALSERSGLASRYIWRVEAGMQNLQLGNIAKIAVGLDLHLSELLAGVEELVENPIPRPPTKPRGPAARRSTT